MADVASDLKSWSATASSNAPAGTTNIGTQLDDNLREIQKVVRQDLATKGADIASATTTDLGAVAGLFHDITGTTTITGFGTVAAGIWKIIKFEGALTLTHNATSLILPGGANITTADGDVAIMFSEGSGNWRCVNYVKASGATLVTVPLSTGGTGASLVDPNADRFFFWDDSAGATAFLAPGGGLNINDTTVYSVASGTSQASTSGTEIDFTGIPAGVKRIEFALSGVSTNGSSLLQIQIGDSGGVETDGYLGSADTQSSGGGTATTSTSGLSLGRTSDSSFVLHGIATFVLIDAATNTWAGTWVGSSSHSGTIMLGSTSKALSATLDRIRLTTVNGTDAFDAGKVNIVYQ